MTKANDLASLLDANGDVVSSALDNVPASDLVNDTTPQLGGTLDTNTNDINFGTNVKSNYGTSAQLMMYHDGSNGWIKGNNTGNNSIAIQSGGTGSVMISGSSGQNIISQQGDAAYLHHAGFAKLITTATGVDVTGTATADGLDLGTTTGAKLTLYPSNYSIGVESNELRIASNAVTSFYSGGHSGTERMRLTADGNLLLAKTATNFATAGIEIRPVGAIDVTRSGGSPLHLNRTSTDGEISTFYQNGTQVGAIGVGNTNRPYIGSGDTGIMFDANNNAIYPWNTSTNNVPASDQVDLGYDATGLKFNNLYLGGGVYLGGTGSANYLDDYEEGVWYPVLKASSTQPTYGATNDVGSYVKIGNMVYVTWYSSVLNITNSGSGGAQIGGLPFTAASGTQEYWLFNYQHGTGIAGTNTSGGYIERNNTNLIFTQQGTVTNSTWAQLNGRYVMVSAAYRTA